MLLMLLLVEQKAQSQNPLDSISSSYIIGFTDPTLLLDFRDFTALVVVAPNPDLAASGPVEASADVLRKTERRTSFSGKISGANKKLSVEEMAAESLLVRHEVFHPFCLSPHLYYICILYDWSYGTCRCCRYLIHYMMIKELIH